MAVSKQGDVDFGADAIRDYNAIRAPWFDHWLKGKQTGVQDEPPVQLFVMGENRWCNFSDYPAPNTRYTHWYLHDAGALNMARPNSAERADSYLYDPMNPVPTVGGNLLIANVPGGAFDQRPIEDRCLIYTSEPLTQDLTVIGNVKFILHAMSSAPDTDWIVRLTDVHPDGYSRLLCDGILRARYRESFERQTLLTPNQVYEFVVDLWATANTFKAGHRIRVAITSSSFPRFDRNLNTGGEFGKEVIGQVALNTVFHDVMRPSHIILPAVG
jgi:putative CocE/NonD family hydrolase